MKIPALALRPFRKSLSYFAVDLDRLRAERTDLCHEMLQELMRGFESRELFPLSHRVFPVENLANAFRYMAQAKHTGKVIISMDEEVEVAPPSGARLHAGQTGLTW